MRSRSLAAVSIAAAVGTLATALSLPGVVRGGQAARPASYPSCGTYWNRNTPVSAAERRANACIVKAAREGRPARAVAALTTIEGDPIVNYVFVLGRRDLLVVVDSTRDAFGARQWSRFRCTGLVQIHGRLGWNGCRSTGTGKPRWLKPVKLRA
jgi:hypothetical protein